MIEDYGEHIDNVDKEVRRLIQEDKPFKKNSFKCMIEFSKDFFADGEVMIGQYGEQFIKQELTAMLKIDFLSRTAPS